MKVFVTAVAALTVVTGTPTASAIIPSPELALLPDHGQVGSSFVVEGSFFPSGTEGCTATIVWNGSLTIGTTTVQTGAVPDTNWFTTSVVVPSAASAFVSYPVEARVDTACGGWTASAQFYVDPTPQLAISSSGSLPGHTFHVFGSGYPYPGSNDCPVQVLWQGIAAPLATAVMVGDTEWGFDAFDLVVPNVPSGTYQIVARGCYPTDVTTTYVVDNPTITLTPSSGPPNTSFRVNGAGFPNREAGTCTVDIRWDGTQLIGTGSLLNANTSFEATVSVPAGAPLGPHLVQVRIDREADCFEGFTFGATFQVTPPPTTTTTSTTTTTTTTSPPPGGPPVTAAPTTRPRARTTPTTTPTTTVPTTTTSSTTTSSTTSSTTSTTTTVAPSGATTTSPTTPPTPPTRLDDGTQALTLEPAAPPPGGGTTATGHGCDPNAPVTVTVGGAPPVHTESDAEGTFRVRLPLPELEPGRYDVVAVCGPELHANVDVILVSAQGGAASSSAVLTFFVLIGVGVWQLRRGIDPTGMG